MSLKECNKIANSIEGNQNGFPVVPGNLGLAELIWAFKDAVFHANTFRDLFISAKMEAAGFTCIYKKAKPGEAMTSISCGYCDDCPVKDYCWKDKHFSK
jgi:hypothetical protein